MLDEHAIARAEQRGEDERDRVLCPGGDEHLVGPGGQAASGVAVGNGGAQGGQPEQFVAVPAEVGAEIVDGAGRGRPERAGRGGQRGVGKSAQGRFAVRGERVQCDRAGGPGRQLRPAAGSAAAAQHLRVAEHVVSRGDGGPADLQRARQLALRRGAACVQWEAAVEHEQPDAIGQGEPAAVRRSPLSELPGEAAGTDPAFDVVHEVQTYQIGPRR